MTTIRSNQKTQGAKGQRPTRGGRMGQISYMRDPDIDHSFEVGDTVEVYCDHEKDKDRTRGWLKGMIVQIDNKMIAVQFRSDVFLTDGWMVPDRILWFPVNSKHIRAMPGKKPKKTETEFPDY